jgi:hypothetical protein
MWDKAQMIYGTVLGWRIQLGRAGPHSSFLTRRDPHCPHSRSPVPVTWQISNSVCQATTENQKMMFFYTMEAVLFKFEKVTGEWGGR